MSDEQRFPMREEFPRWYREVSITDNRERLDARWKGVISLIENAEIESIKTMIAVALRTKPRPAPANIEAFRKTFHAIDDLFDMDENERELEILSASALVTLFDQNSNRAALAALATTTAAFGGARSAKFAVDLVGAAEKAIARLAERQRTRPELTAAISAPAKITFDTAIAAVKQAWTPEGVVQAFGTAAETTNTAIAAISRSVGRAIDKANTFAKIQDEELQMLWWLFGGRSKEMDCPFGDIPQDAQPLVLSVELADMTKFLPGPASAKPMLSRAGLKERKKSNLPASVNACGADLLKALVDGEDISPITQPIHFAVKNKVETGDNTAWIAAWSAITGIDADLPLPAIELGNLFYRERLVALFSGD